MKDCSANLLIAAKFSSTYYNLKIFSINTTKTRCNILLLETVRQQCIVIQLILQVLAFKCGQA